MQALNLGSLYRHREFAPLVLRVVVGFFMMLHGLMKLQDIEGTTGYFGSLGIPLAPAVAWLVALIESLGGLALILGAFTRVSALLLACVLLGAIIFARIPAGSFGALPFSLMGDTGFELEAVLLSANLALALLGAGIWSVDKRLFGGDAE